MVEILNKLENHLLDQRIHFPKKIVKDSNK